MKRLFTSLSTSAWRRVLVLIWRTQSWFVLGLLALMVLGGLVPAARIQVTSAIIQAGRHPQGLVNSALLFGGLPRARSHLRLPLGMAHPPPATIWKTGRFSGKDFPLQPDGTLRCPVGQALRVHEHRREVGGPARGVHSQYS